MLIPSLKLGPEPERYKEIDEVKPASVEVWFDINRAGEYDQLFATLQKQHIPFGLHFWGSLPDGTWTNFCYPDSNLINQTIKLMRQTIDIAAVHHCTYVNIHPGNRAKVAINFAQESFSLLSKPVELALSLDLFMEHATALHSYALQRGTILTVETVPLYDTIGWKGETPRQSPLNLFQLSLDAVVPFAARGGFIANDVCHTAATIVADETHDVRRHVFEITNRLFDQTRLIHIGFIVPPYNGTDMHDSLTNPKFTSTKAVPNRDDSIHLLKPFAQTDYPVWVLVEPETDHPANYQALLSIISEMSV